MTENINSDIIDNNISYQEVYKRLLSYTGRSLIGDDKVEEQKVVSKINKFLEVYPDILKKTDDSNKIWTNLSIKQVFINTIKTAINIINDIGDIISKSQSLSVTTFRRKIVDSFLQEDRRVYVGIWLILFSFILYFIDLSS